MYHTPAPGTPLQPLPAGGQHASQPESGENYLAVWKMKGYPSLAKFMGSSDNFFMLRRFDTLNARVLLMQQDHLVQQEERLEMLDARMRREGGPELRSDTMRPEFGLDPERQRLLFDIMTNLKLYNEYISSYSTLKARPIAPDHQIRQLKTYFDNNSGIITFDERAFLSVEGDVVPVVPKAKTPIRRMLEYFIFFPVNRLFRSKRSTEDYVLNASESGFEWFVTVFELAIGLALFVGPMWWLKYVQHDVYRLLLITVFVIIFAASLTLSTLVGSFEVLGATAAYSAVLMVFLQLQSGGN